MTLYGQEKMWNVKSGIFWGGAILLSRTRQKLRPLVPLQKEQPGDLLQALGIAVDAGVVAHDVASRFTNPERLAIVRYTASSE